MEWKEWEKERSVNSKVKYTPDAQKGAFFFVLFFSFWIKLVEMEYVMRLYLGADNMTPMSNGTAKVKIHYLPHYDLIKLHRIIFIFLSQRAPSYVAFPPCACIRKVVLQEKSWAYSLRSAAEKKKNPLISQAVRKIKGLNF